MEEKGERRREGEGRAIRKHERKVWRMEERGERKEERERERETERKGGVIRKYKGEGEKKKEEEKAE